MEGIIIEKIETSTEEVWGGWKVTQGDKYADGLTFEEMIGLVCSLTIPGERPCLHWMATKELHKERRDRLCEPKDNLLQKGAEC